MDSTSRALLIMGLMNMWGDSGDQGPQRHDPLDKIDLEQEYELIKQKKSRLTFSQRERVVSIVEKRTKTEQTT